MRFPWSKPKTTLPKGAPSTKAILEQMEKDGLDDSISETAFVVEFAMRYRNIARRYFGETEEEFYWEKSKKPK